MKEKKEEHKHLRVKEDTHKAIKVFASLHGMTIDEALKYLVENAKL